MFERYSYIDRLKLWGRANHSTLSYPWLYQYSSTISQYMRISEPYPQNKDKYSSKTSINWYAWRKRCFPYSKMDIKLTNSLLSESTHEPSMDYSLLKITTKIGCFLTSLQICSYFTSSIFHKQLWRPKIPNDPLLSKKKEEDIP